MKKIIGIFLLLTGLFANAQQYGAQWVMGDRESVLDFRGDTLLNYPIGPVMPMFLTNANICDSSGNLLYYTNGIYIAGADGNQIMNGDGLSPCDYTTQYAGIGLNIPQAALFLPKPGDDSRYYLIHFSNDTDNGNLPGNLYYSQILNSNFGVVEKKNVCFGKGIFRQGGVTACKHANGRDWWLIIGLHNSNEYFKYLVTPDTILGPFTQSIGPAYNGPLDLPYSKFSQDGSKYVTSCYQDSVLIMNFDRCNGMFSNPITLFNQACIDGTSCSGATAVEFSSNGRFLYVTTPITLNQYDLSDANLQHDSIILYQADSNDVARMNFLQLAPNGKIYGSCHNGGFYFIHAINYPDIKGGNAEYVDTAFTTLTANTDNFPNMVNYQLGPLVGSSCDTITTGITAPPNLPGGEGLLRVMPNPADKYLYVEMGMQGKYEFDLLNDVGQIVETRTTRQVDNFDTERLPSGIYFLQAIDKSNSNRAAIQKVVIQH